MIKKASILILALAVLAVFTTAAFCQKAATDEKAQQSQQVMPKKIGLDTNYNGKPDRWEYYNEKGQVTKVESDANEDGVVEETIIYENGKPVKGAKDTNKDGKTDVWIDF